MKSLLITEEEKRRIIKMHEKGSLKNYLFENPTNTSNVFTANGYQTATEDLVNSLYKKKIDLTNYPNIYQKGKTKLASDSNNQNFIFIEAPEGITNIGPYNVTDNSDLLKK